MDELKLSVASSPHASHPVGTQSLMRDVLIALLPALIGTAICALTHLICHPQTVLAAYGWLLLLALASLVTMLLLLRGDSGASVLFLQLFGMMVPVPLLMGFGSSWWLLRRRNSL